MNHYAVSVAKELVFLFDFFRDDFKKIPPLDAKKLEVFRTVREITGALSLT